MQAYTQSRLINNDILVYSNPYNKNNKYQNPNNKCMPNEKILNLRLLRHPFSILTTILKTCF
jgi:hypothetical protein